MTCPRCEQDQAYKILEAEDSTWEVYRCPRCNFNWRSTEGDEITDPARYDRRFKLTEERIRTMMPSPPIPPLQKA